MPCKNRLPLRDSKNLKVRRWLEGECCICQLKPSHSLGKKRKKYTGTYALACLSLCCQKGFDRIKWTILNVYQGSIWSVVSAECPSFHCLFACVLWFHGLAQVVHPALQGKDVSLSTALNVLHNRLTSLEKHKCHSSTDDTMESHSHGFLNWNKLPYF